MKSLRINILVLLASLSILPACNTKAPELEAQEVAPAVQPHGGTTYMAKAADWCEEVVCTGRVDAPPQSQAVVHAPVGGFIRAVRHLPGDYIEQGTQLALLEHQDILVLQEDYLSTVSRLDLLVKADERNSLLAAADAVPQRLQEESHADRQGLELRKAGLAARLRLLGIDPKRLETTQAIQPSIAVLAPISGYLTLVDAIPGQYAAPNDRLFWIVDDAHMHIALQVMAKDAGKVREDQDLDYVVTGDTAHRAGKIHRVNKAVDPEKGVVEVHAHLAESAHPPMGAYVNARICVGTKALVVVPIPALVGEGEDHWVWVKTGDNFEKRSVRPGSSKHPMVSILEGLKAGELVWVP